VLSGVTTTDAHWIVLSDQAGPINPAGMAEVVQQGSLVVELTPPKGDAAVLLDYKSDAGWQRALSIFADATAGIVLLHRQGAAAQRYHLPGPLPRDWALARLTYSWNGPARAWSLRFEDVNGAWALQADGSNPVPFAGADLLALCDGPNAARRDPSVQWFGACVDTALPTPAAWIGQRTPVDTARGPVAAENLRIGDMIATLDNGHQPLRGLHKMTMPNRGRFAPVLLRAPYFAAHVDLLVSQGQLTLLSGSAVEYLFGEDAVLAPAVALRDGNSALLDNRRSITAGVALDLGSQEIIFADGCPLLCNPDAATGTLPYRLLHDYEALPLQSLLGRGGQRSAA
jgi:Hint domain